MLAVKFGCCWELPCPRGAKIGPAVCWWLAGIWRCCISLLEEWWSFLADSGMFSDSCVSQTSCRGSSRPVLAPAPPALVNHSKCRQPQRKCRKHDCLFDGVTRCPLAVINFYCISIRLVAEAHENTVCKHRTLKHWEGIFLNYHEVPYTCGTAGAFQRLCSLCALCQRVCQKSCSFTPELCFQQ